MYLWYRFLERHVYHQEVTGVKVLVSGAGPKNLSLWTEGLRERLLSLPSSVERSDG